MIYLKIERGFLLRPSPSGEKEAVTIEKRIWIRSGIVEELDQRQLEFLDFVLQQIQHYYRELHGTHDCYRHPLTLARLRKLCNRSGASVLNAVRLLSNSIPSGSDSDPPVHYDRVPSARNSAHRPYRIFLRRLPDDFSPGKI
jgi:hypothetical protein